MAFLQQTLCSEETLPKNIATSIKDTRFLDFFFRSVRPVGPREEELMAKHGISLNEYPYVSPCGSKELNFIRPAATPIVFHTFDKENSALVYAGTKTQRFQASDLAISKETGRVYHRCSHMESRASSQEKPQQYALVRSAVVVTLSDQIGPLPDDTDQPDLSGLAFCTEDNEYIPIPWLSLEAEPGLWAMPFSENDPDG